MINNYKEINLKKSLMVKFDIRLFFCFQVVSWDGGKGEIKKNFWENKRKIPLEF